MYVFMWSQACIPWYSATLTWSWLLKSWNDISPDWVTGWCDVTLPWNPISFPLDITLHWCSGEFPVLPLGHLLSTNVQQGLTPMSISKRVTLPMSPEGFISAKLKLHMSVCHLIPALGGTTNYHRSKIQEILLSFHQQSLALTLTVLVATIDALQHFETG